MTEGKKIYHKYFFFISLQLVSYQDNSIDVTIDTFE